MVAALVLAASLCLGLAAASAATPPQFRWLAPRQAPRDWKRVTVPSVGSVLSFPRSLARIQGDSGSVSVAKKDASGRVLIYLNVTPKQGNERLRTWPAFRLDHNREESDAVHAHGQALGLHFIGGTGSCVIDDYLTRGKVNHYREISCFVQGRRTASVLVAAALQSEWKQAAPLLERAVSAYRAG